MTDHAIRSRLRERLGSDFGAWDQGYRGTLFVHWDWVRRQYIRLRITAESRAEHANEIPAAVDEAITILQNRDGDVVIRNDESGELTVVRESASLEK